MEKRERKQYIDKIRDLLNNMVVDGHIKTGDEWVAHNDLENALHRLLQAFENDINNKEN